MFLLWLVNVDFKCQYRVSLPYELSFRTQCLQQNNRRMFCGGLRHFLALGLSLPKHKGGKMSPQVLIMIKHISDHVRRHLPDVTPPPGGLVAGPAHLPAHLTATHGGSFPPPVWCKSLFFRV